MSVPVYADTSFFVSLYISDTHTVDAESRVAGRPLIWMTPLHVAEWSHAIEQHVFRKVLTKTEADKLGQRFREHRSRGLWKNVAVPEHAFEVCAELAKKHAGQFGVRTLDSLHVASALELNAEAFWTYDERQNKLARAVGLRTLQVALAKARGKFL